MTTPELTDLGDARVLNELSGSIPLTDTLRARRSHLSGDGTHARRRASRTVTSIFALASA